MLSARETRRNSLHGLQPSHRQATEHSKAQTPRAERSFVASQLARATRSPLTVLGY